MRRRKGPALSRTWRRERLGLEGPAPLEATRQLLVATDAGGSLFTWPHGIHCSRTCALWRFPPRAVRVAAPMALWAAKHEFVVAVTAAGRRHVEQYEATVTVEPEDLLGLRHLEWPAADPVD